jgi:hypothetical protein
MIKSSYSFRNYFQDRRTISIVSLRLLLIASILLSILLLPFVNLSRMVDNALAASQASTNTDECFEQVNDGAFGLSEGPYKSEESYEVLVFNDQLYVGMEADNSLGARIWRTKPGVMVPTSQADWEEVAADINGYPFGETNITQNDHIDSLAAFNGYLYASTANGGSNFLGTRVFRSPSGDPGTWEDAVQNLGPGFNNIFNMNFKDMQVFDGWLCGGTQNWVVGTQVWCTADGTTWVQKNSSGFGDTGYQDITVEVWSGAVFDGALYFGVQNTGGDRGDRGTDVGKLVRTTNLNGTPTWTEVYIGLHGSYRVDVLGDLNGFLYIAVRSESGIVILRSPSGDPGTWTQVNLSGMDGDPGNTSVIADGSIVHDDSLILGISNANSGVQLWKTVGTLVGSGPLVEWVQVGDSGIGDEKNVMTQLVAYHEEVYAWTTNYVTGQQVRKKSVCSQSVLTEEPTESPTSEPVEPSPTVTPTIEPTIETTPEPSPTPQPTNQIEPTETSEPTEVPIETPDQDLDPSPMPPTPIPCTNDSESCEEQGISDPTLNIFIPLVLHP